MQLVRWVISILIRRENNQVTFGRKSYRREGPLVQVIRVVGQVIAAQIHGDIVRVKNFDPIRVFAILIFQSRVVVGEKLVNARGGERTDRGCKEKTQQDAATEEDQTEFRHTNG